MRSLLIAALGSALYLVILLICMSYIRRQKKAGQASPARRYTAVIIITAIPLVILPWSRLIVTSAPMIKMMPSAAPPSSRP